MKKDHKGMNQSIEARHGYIKEKLNDFLRKIIQRSNRDQGIENVFS